MNFTLEALKDWGIGLGILLACTVGIVSLLWAVDSLIQKIPLVFRLTNLLLTVGLVCVYFCATVIFLVLLPYLVGHSYCMGPK